MDLWVFLQYRGTPLTNNEAERCLRAALSCENLLRDEFRSRRKFRSSLLSVIETSKKRGLIAD